MNTSMNTENTSDVSKTAVIKQWTFRLKIDISALQETGLAGQGSIRENDYTFFWHGKPVYERREHGVGFDGSDGNERITTLRLQTKKGTATFVSVYAHTLHSDEQVKYTFYE